MSSKEYLSIIAGLILLNIVTVLYFIVGEDTKEETSEAVASVGKKEISRTDWINELEAIHGKDVLTAMINEEGILQLAHKYRLTVSDEELDVESAIRQVLYGSNGDAFAYSSGDFKMKLKVSILLEKLLTKDVMITDDEVEVYYKKNESLLKFSDLYCLSHIVVEEEKEANAIVKELAGGADFAAMAIERSRDKYTADKGGDLGCVSIESETFPEEYKNATGDLKVGKWSQPIKTKNGYAILYMHNQIDESMMSFNKIKSALKRKVAMEQMNTPMTAEMLWEQFDVDWIYGK